MQPKRSADEMVRIIESNPTRLEALKRDPLPELTKLRDEALKEVPAYVGDKLLYRIAVFTLSLIALIAALGSGILVLAGKNTPEVLIALGSAAVGALVGLFAPAPSGK